MLLFLIGEFSIILLTSETTFGQPLSNGTAPNANATVANATVVNQAAQPSPDNLNLEAVSVYEEVAQNGSITIDLPLKNDQSPNANWTYTLESLPLHGTIQPIRIGDPIPNGIIRYGAASNFVGVDYLMYKIHNETSSTNVGSITIKTYVTQPILSDPIQRMLVSFGIASVSIIAITVAAWYIISKLRKSMDPINSTKFWDIIRSNNMDPSLSVFQFFLWTIVLMFVLFSIYLIRIFGGVTDAIPGPPPFALLALTGITFVTPFGSSLISALRYPKADTVGETAPESSQNLRPPMGEMLREFGKPSLSRFQMFGWTWISIIIYLSVYGAELARDYGNVVNLSIPDMFPLLVALMGLSQVVFLGAKANVTSQIEITKVFPRKVTRGGNLSIFGLNFGRDRQDVWIGTRRIGSDDREHLLGWSDGRIDIIIPRDIPEPAPGKGYEIMVVKGGSSKIAFEGGSPIRITLRSAANQ